MNVRSLSPLPTAQEAFQRSRLRFLPEGSGCYVLSTFDGTVLYVGLSVSLRRRMNEHLDDAKKTSVTAAGRAVLIHWLEHQDVARVERTWMNIHIENEGKMPVLNGVFSPVSA